MARVRYNRRLPREFARSTSGRRVWRGKAERLERMVRAELRAGGLADDPPAREYLEELTSTTTDRGGRVLTTASRAHFVEWGTYLRQPDAPMRTAARRFGDFTER